MHTHCFLVAMSCDPQMQVAPLVGSIVSPHIIQAFQNCSGLCRLFGLMDWWDKGSTGVNNVDGENFFIFCIQQSVYLG